MALGNVYSSNSQKKNTSPSTYSAYKMSNPTSTIDPTNLGFSFWNGLLKVTIAPKKPANDDSIAYDYDNAISIYITPTKARIFKNEIEEFLKNKGKYVNCGVSTPKGCIYVCDGSEFNSKSSCLVIKLVDETGETQSSIAYEFNKKYHFAIRNVDSANKYEGITDDYDDLEIQELLTVLKTFVESSTNAMAATVIEQSHYTTDRINNNIESIAEKLGVETGRKSPNSYSSKSSFFSANSNNTSSSSSSKVTTYNSYDELNLDD